MTRLCIEIQLLKVQELQEYGPQLQGEGLEPDSQGLSEGDHQCEVALPCLRRSDSQIKLLHISSSLSDPVNKRFLTFVLVKFLSQYIFREPRKVSRKYLPHLTPRFFL